MKVSYAKGLNAAGMILFTIQLFVHFFDYVANPISIFAFLIDNWTCVAGYCVLGVMFLRKKKVSTDYILTIIGVLLWVSRFLKVLNESNGEWIIAFITCAAGILGSVITIIALVFEVLSAKQDNNCD